MWVDHLTAKDPSSGGKLTFENRGGVLFRVSAVPSLWKVGCDGIIFNSSSQKPRSDRDPRMDVSQTLKPAFSDLHLFKDRIKSVANHQRVLVFNILSDLFREYSVGRRISGIAVNPHPPSKTPLSSSSLSTKSSPAIVTEAQSDGHHGSSSSAAIDKHLISDDRRYVDTSSSSTTTTTTKMTTIFRETSTFLFDENLITIILDDYAGGLLHSTNPTLCWYLDISGWNLDDSMFFQSSKIDFTDAIIKDCTFLNSHWDKMSVRCADFSGSNFSKSSFTDISFDECILDNCDFSECTFKSTRKFKLMMAARLTSSLTTTTTHQMKSATRKFVESGVESSSLVSRPSALDDDHKKNSDDDDGVGPPVKPGGFRALSAGVTSTGTTTSTPYSPELHSIACVFGQVDSMRGCKIDRCVYDLNPGWFDSMGVPTPDYPPPRPKFVATEARIADCITEESYWEYGS